LVGFLVQDDATAKVLAPNLGASNGSGDTGLGRDHHPRIGGAAGAARLSSSQYFGYGSIS
jgi:hypothetical protein